MAAADAVGSVAAIAADRRRHSIDVASITFQPLKPNGVSDLQPQSTSAAPSGKRSRNASQGQGRVPASGGVGTAFVDADDASTEGQGKSMQGQGLFRRPYNGLGKMCFVRRLLGLELRYRDELTTIKFERFL